MPLFPRDPRRGAVRSFEPSRTRASSLDRTIFFSDSIHAIAITLLVVQITVPEVAAGQLGAALADRGDEYFAYALSFVVIGLYWLRHHRMFDYIVREDRLLLRLNLLLLGCVAFLPFAAAVLGRYGAQSSAVITYAATLLANGLAWWALWWWASADRRLISDALSDAEVRALRIRVVVPPTVFAVSIPVALVSPLAGELTWSALIPALAVLRRRAGPSPL